MTDAPHSLGHLAHTLLLAGGVAGMAALLVPQAAARAGFVAARDPHDRVAARADALRRSASEGSLVHDLRTAPAWTTDALPRADAAEAAPGSAWVAAAVVASASAGVAHVVVALHHGAHHVLLWALMLLAAGLQLTWARALVSGRHHRGDLLVAGLVLHASVLGAWVASRTLGLPAWLDHAGPETVGPWGVACAVWQGVALVAAVRALAADGPVPAPAWGGQAVRAWVAGSATAVLTLAMAGVAS